MIGHVPTTSCLKRDLIKKGLRQGVPVTDTDQFGLKRDLIKKGLRLILEPIPTPDDMFETRPD
ncbi:protein of unknown function [Methylocaldum szegediense]|uniref:Uncharacterized protein n=1 Tax=Methylocaldum szegediense TaxID=73780 RepID=A0ABN8WZL5_9GAMM|nr:protein of unknown function [Methylocaldum szegediense]